MRKVYYGLVISFIALILMWTCIHSLFEGMCGNQIVTEQLSPDKKYKLVVFVRDCGATTGYSTQISILSSDKKLMDDQTGNVLRLSDDYHGNYLNNYGGAEARVEWVAVKKILIYFDINAEALRKESKVMGVEFLYEDIHKLPLNSKK
jgi:hypothetical protein